MTTERNRLHLVSAARLSLYRQDFARFAREQLKIKPKAPVGAPIMPLVLNPPQHLADRVAEAQRKHKGWVRITFLKSRQPGGSTWSEARGFHIVALNPNIAAMVVAQDDKTAAHIFGITRLFYDCLDASIKPQMRYSTKKELVFENPDEKTRARWPGLRSKITFDTAKNIHAGTGQTLHVLHVSEGAKYGDPRTVWQSLTPSVPLVGGTSIINESAPFPTGEWFREQCLRAKSGKDLYQYVFAAWYLSPEHALPLEAGDRLKLDADEKYLTKHYGLGPEQLQFRRKRIEELGGDALAAELFNSEYPSDDESCWISTELQAFDMRKLHECKSQLRPALRTVEVYPGPTLLDTPSGSLSIWEEPQRGEVYDVGCDVATGAEDGDWSVAEVIKRRTREQVAEYRAHIGPIDYGDVLYWIGRYYFWAQLGVEVEGVGFATNEQLQKRGYPSLYIWRYRGEAAPKLSKFSGWKTQPDSKKYMVAFGRHLLGHDELTIRSAVLWNEMRVFSAYPTDAGIGYAAPPGMHDDATMAYLIALVISEDERFGAWAPSAMLPKPEPVPFREPGLYDEWDDRLAKGDPAGVLAGTLNRWRKP